jgi:hypothetical protein
MKHPRFAAIVVLLGAVAAHASQADWKKALEEQLNAENPVTKVGMQVLTLNYNRITAPGGSYLVRIPGIYADLADTKQAIVKTNIVDGAAEQQKGFMASLANTHEARSLQKGEAVYILHERVKDDAVEFELLTQEATDHMGLQQRYRSVVDFSFPKGTLATMSVPDLKKAIDPVFATAEVANATQSKTIALGMQPDAVKAALGNPDKIVDLGAKQIYVYKDLKVVFANNAVADVQ